MIPKRIIRIRDLDDKIIMRFGEYKGQKVIDESIIKSRQFLFTEMRQDYMITYLEARLNGGTDEAPRE